MAFTDDIIVTSFSPNYDELPQVAVKAPLSPSTNATMAKAVGESKLCSSFYIRVADTGGVSLPLWRNYK